MSISKNLVVSIGEAVEIGGDPSALLLKTTDAGTVLVEVAVAKFAVKLEDIEEAMKALKEFIVINKHIETTSTTVEAGSMTIIYGDDEASNS